MIKKFLICLIAFLSMSNCLFAGFTTESLLTPMFLGASETDTLFRNPAELPLYENMFGGRLTYGLQDSKFGGSFIFHIPDYGLGDMAFSTEFFGTNFAQNLIWVADNTRGDGHFTFSQGGFKGLFTWAKKTPFLTIGFNGKMYNYKDIEDVNNVRNGLGMDLGIYFTPLKDLYLGAVANDFNDTIIRDSSWQNEEKRVKQEVRLSAAVLSGTDMSFAVGVPLSKIWELRHNPTKAWKRISFQGRKVLGDFLIVGAGYNSKDIFYDLGIKLSDFFSLNIIGSKDQTTLKSTDAFYMPDQFILSFTYAISFNAIKEMQDSMFNNSAPMMRNPVIDFPINMMRRSVEKPWLQRSETRKTENLENKLNRMEEKLNKIESKQNNPKALRAELDDLLDKIAQKQDRLKELKEKLQKQEAENSSDRFSTKLDIDKLEDSLEREVIRIKEIRSILRDLKE